MAGPDPPSPSPGILPREEGVTDISDSVTFMSYNPTGADTVKCQWIRDIFSEFEVNYCALQEHFKTVKTTEQWFRKQFCDFHTYVIPANRAPGVDCGRGRGGLAQFSLKQLAVRRERIISKNPRVQAQILHFPSCKILWINSYLPCDPQLQHYDDMELLTCLAEVESIVTANPGAEILWSGDLNYDLSRNNHFTRTVAFSIERLGLVPLWKDNNIDYTHIHTDGVSSSTIDHFMLSPALLPLVEECGPLHRGDNLSRHSPVFVKLKISGVPHRPLTEQSPPRRRPAWDRATEAEVESYTTRLHQRLQGIHIPGSMVHCRDPLCNEPSHTKMRDSMVLDILLSMVETSYTTIPLSGLHAQREVIPGWSAEVEPFRAQSKYCFRVWLADGKPSTGEIHSAKIRSHSQFKHAVRRVRRSAKLHQAKALYGAALDGDMKLMKEMKRVLSGRGPTDELPSTVDGATGEQEVADKFREVYEELYNSAGSEVEMAALQVRIHSLIQSEDSMKEVEKITGDVVKKAVGLMKTRKSDVSQGFSSECLLNAPDILFQLLAMVFRDWIKHGTVTPSLLACSFIPLIKSSLKNPSATDSYRAIAGSSLILKLFERCVLLLWGDRLHSDSLQFGYKKGTGTTAATWLVQEVLQQYLKAGSKPICSVLDCSKAFDLAKFSICFSRMLEKRESVTTKPVPAIIVRVLAFCYTEQMAWVRWGRNTTSATFGISNGTRQGSVASPTFWSIYLDPMITALRKAGLGCHLAAGGVFVGVVVYADDVVLLAPSRDAMQKMLNTCSEFASENNIKFSTSKSSVIYVTGERGAGLPKPLPLLLNDCPLPWVERADHLGHTLHQDGTMKQDCRQKRAKFINESVKIREAFGFAHPVEQLTAVEKHCCSMYGSNLWNLAGKEAEMVYSAWRTGVKLTWEVPRGTRTYLLQTVLALGFTSLKVNLLVRFRKFFRSLLDNPSHEAWWWPDWQPGT